jgi:murein DD-endopeptidase / murein LD-carboxypeptidase
MRGPDEVVAAARQCIGARFRPHGRRPAWGLDCVGVAAIAFCRTVPGRYPLRGGRPDAIIATIDHTGLHRQQCADVLPGALLLIEAGPTQFHLAIATGEGFVHADAGLRRVVEAPARPPGPILAMWTEQG